MGGSYNGPAPLGDSHHVEDFDCGSDEQTLWLRKRAHLAHRMRTAKVYVVCRQGEMRVAAYYAMTVGSVEHEEAPKRLTRNAPKYQIGVVILARLGVDLRDQGQGLGRALVVDALRKVAAIEEQAGVRALLIHAESEEARSFYEHLGEFIPSPVDSLQLFLPIKNLRRVLSETT